MCHYGEKILKLAVNPLDKKDTMLSATVLILPFLFEEIWKGKTNPFKYELLLTLSEEISKLFL